MTDPRAGDERLREAFQALADAPDGECSADTLDHIWKAVSGELPAEERRKLVDRMAADPACAEAWRVAQELWHAAERTASVTPSRHGAWWTPSWLAAAAVLVLVTSLGVFSLLRPQQQDEFRATPANVVESLVPSEAMLPRDAFRLRWTPGPAGSRYQVTVTTDDLRLLDTAADLTVPEIVVDRAALEAVAPGAPVLWRVEVSLPDGGKVSSRTFMTRVE